MDWASWECGNKFAKINLDAEIALRVLLFFVIEKKFQQDMNSHIFSLQWDERAPSIPSCKRHANMRYKSDLKRIKMILKFAIWKLIWTGNIKGDYRRIFGQLRCDISASFRETRP